MTAQALIFDLSAFPGMQTASQASGTPAGLDVERLLDKAVADGLPCALISELPYSQAEQQLRRRFGDTAHHIFSVVLTGADFKERGHKAPYSVVLNQMGVPPDDVLAVTSSPRAIAAARSARIGVQAGRESGTKAVRVTVRKARNIVRPDARH
jgi:beta-phosphoglucomutase-like phosphatase (HAD superfamily)